MQRLVLVLALLVLGLFGGCGGGSGVASSQQTPADAAAVLDLDAATPAGVDPQVWAELTARLAEQLATSGVSAPAPAVPPGAAGLVSDYNISPSGDTSGRLSWSYVNRGDYNQDGLVASADLTPVGIYYERHTGSPDWDSARRADGNGDGFITVADVTVIGQNYQHRVDGYQIQESATPDDAGGWQTLLTAEYSVATVAGNGWQREFGIDMASLQDGMFYRVIPYALIDGTRTFGSGSNSVQWVAAALPATPKNLSATDGTFVGRIDVHWSVVPLATAYMVFRDEPDNLVDVVVGETTYLDATDGDFTQHEYWVRAWNVRGESELSASDTGFSGLATPLGLIASDGVHPNRVQLNWEPVAGAEGYEVYRDEAAAAVGVAGDVDNWADSAVDPLLHTYRIRAVNPLCRSMPSNMDAGYKRGEATGTWNQAGANAQHTYSTATLGPASPEVKWTKYFNTTAHSNPALSPDESTVYVGSRDNRVQAFNRLTREVLWRFVTTDDVIAQPVVNAAGQILVGNTSGVFYCINPDGTEAWHYDAAGAINDRAALADSGAAYFASDDGTLTCLDSAGSLSWSFTCDGPVIGHPVVHTDGYAYVIAGDYQVGFTLHALDALGNERWQYSADEWLYNSPALDVNGDIYFTEADVNEYNLVRLSSAGDLQWRYDMESTVYGTPVVSSSGVVYAANSMDSFGEGRYQLHAINPDGTRAWTAGSITVACESEVVIGPDGNIYLCNTGYYTLQCYSTTGDRLWELTDEEYNNAPLAFPVIATDGMVMITDYYGSLLSYLPGTGELESYIEITADRKPVHHLAGEPVFSSDGTLYIGGDELRALNPAGGELWSRTHEPIIGVAVDDEGNAYAAGEQSLYAYSPDGTLQWTLSGEHDDFEKSPTLFNDRLYLSSGKVVDTDGVLAWETGTGAYYTPVVSSNGLSYWLGLKNEHGLTLHGFQQDGTESFLIGLDEDDFISGLAVDLAGALRTKSRAGLVQSFDAWLVRQWVYDPAGSMPSSYGGLAIGSDGTAYGSFGLGVLEPAKVWAVKPDGEPLWSYDHTERCFGNIVVDGAGYLYLCDDTGYMYCLNPDGSERWRLDLTDADVDSLSLSPDGTLYVVGPHQNLMAVGERD